MTRKIELIIITLTAVNLLIIAVVGYTVQWRDHPEGILLVTKGGAVKFDHERHIQHGSPGLVCRQCHHLIKGREGIKTEPQYNECRDCHYYKKISLPCRNVNLSLPGSKNPAGPAYNDQSICYPECEKDEIHKRCIGRKCVSCHKKQECNFCHYQ